MNVLLIGSRGQLGQEFKCYLKQNYPAFKVICYGESKEQDITNFDRTKSFITDNGKFDVVINCAALTDVQYCENNPKEAKRHNSIGPMNLASICNSMNIKLVHFSTDFVFDGENNINGYSEFSNPNPINEYGLSKLIGENYIRCYCSNYLIIRTAWLYGQYGRNNFLQKLMNKVNNALDGEIVLDVLDDEIGSPTNAYDLVEKTLTLLQNKQVGIWHVVNYSIGVSRYAFAKCFLDMVAPYLNNKKVTVNPTKRNGLSALRRPSNSTLISTRDVHHNYKKMRTWDEALKSHVGNLYN